MSTLDFVNNRPSPEERDRMREAAASLWLIPAESFVTSEFGLSPIPRPELDLRSPEIGPRIHTDWADHPIWFMPEALRKTGDREDLSTLEGQHLYSVRIWSALSLAGLASLGSPDNPTLLQPHSPLWAFRSADISEPMYLERFERWLNGEEDHSRQSASHITVGGWLVTPEGEELLAQVTRDALVAPVETFAACEVARAGSQES